MNNQILSQISNIFINVFVNSAYKDVKNFKLLFTQKKEKNKYFIYGLRIF